LDWRGSDGGVVSFAESHRSIVAVHHQEGDRIEIGAHQTRRSEIGSTFRRDDAFKQVQFAGASAQHLLSTVVATAECS
jgi:hypothetical protein